MSDISASRLAAAADERPDLSLPTRHPSSVTTRSHSRSIQENLMPYPNTDHAGAATAGNNRARPPSQGDIRRRVRHAVGHRHPAPAAADSGQADRNVESVSAERITSICNLANILETPGWSLRRVEDAMRAIKFGDQVDNFRTNIERFRCGDFDDDIRKSGFDVAFCHRVLDQD